MLSKLSIIGITIFFNVFHLFIPAQVINYNFDPLLGSISLLIYLSIIYFTSSFKKDYLYFLIISISFLSQICSYYLNGGVPDYINLVFFDSNIPDFFITITILTWWYLRVYKHSNLNPAELKQDA